jgi:hypothetical protein
MDAPEPECTTVPEATGMRTLDSFLCVSGAAGSEDGAMDAERSADVVLPGRLSFAALLPDGRVLSGLLESTGGALSFLDGISLFTDGALSRALGAADGDGSDTLPSFDDTLSGAALLVPGPLWDAALLAANLLSDAALLAANLLSDAALLAAGPLSDTALLVPGPLSDAALLVPDSLSDAQPVKIANVKDKTNTPHKSRLSHRLVILSVNIPVVPPFPIGSIV